MQLVYTERPSLTYMGLWGSLPKRMSCIGWWLGVYLQHIHQQSLMFRSTFLEFFFLFFIFCLIAQVHFIVSDFD